MSTSLEFQPAAGDWAVMPTTADDAQRFANLLHSKEYSGLSALGILYAAQIHLARHADLQEATLVYGHDEMVWPTPAKQLVVALSSIGYSLRRNPIIDEVVERENYVLFEGQMPPPMEVMAVPGLTFLHRQLTHYARKGARPHGFNFTRFSRDLVTNDSVVIGFANPAVGACMELELQLAPLKEQHGFPPPRPKIPKQWGGQL